VERWTVTTQGTLVAGIPRHFIRIHPAAPGDSHASEDANEGMLAVSNQPPGAPWQFPAKEIVDAGFLELVRYGIRKAGEPLLEDSLKVVDTLLKVHTPFGPVWRRYNHDGYGQREGGAPYAGWGRGRAWPLLTGERAHYELAAGRDPTPYVRALESFAGATGLLPEQVWDEADHPEFFMYLGRPTGSAMPLMWAHAEYVKLLRSVRDGAVYDSIAAVAARYQRAGRSPSQLEIWKFNRQVRTIVPGWTLRLQAAAPFCLRWTSDEWQSFRDISSTATSIGVHFADLAVSRTQRAPLRFTFFWPGSGRWEGRDFVVWPATA